jgi:Zn-dependent protease
MPELKQEILQILYLLPAVVLGFSVHEFAHAFCAVALGDDTPKLAGRFTLNPFKHIDLIGLAMVLLFGFGWAKPVSYNPQKLKKPIEHSVIIAMAGPVANLVFAVLCMGMYALAAAFLPAGWLLIILSKMVSINVMLFIFNLVPLPPLDGSHILFWAIPERFQALRQGYLRYGYWALTGIILAQALLNVEILPVGTMIASLTRLLARLFGLG